MKFTYIIYSDMGEELMKIDKINANTEIVVEVDDKEITLTNKI